MNKIFLLSLGLIFGNSYASDIVYKCTSPNGEVSYLNVTKDRKGICAKTELGSHASTTYSVNNKNSTKSNIAVASYSPSVEQKERDNKRKNILMKELDEEKNQLTTVQNMLANINTKDPLQSAQLTQLNEMKNIHDRNISTLQRELGISNQSDKVTSNLAKQ